MAEAPQSTVTLSWFGIVRLGLVQMGLGAVVVFATSTLNRVMVIECGLPAIVPGLLVAFHYMIQVLRPGFGHGADRGGWQAPWIIGGMAGLALGGALAAAAVALIAARHPLPGLVLAVAAYALIGLGVAAAGTSVLVLLAKSVAPARRAPAATIVWTMMIAGFILTAAIAKGTLDPFSPERLVAVAGGIAALAFLLTLIAIRGIERGATRSPAEPTPARFGQALAETWADAKARRFALFVFISMLAFSAQELMLEPFAGAVFALTPGATAGLAGLQHAGLLLGMIVVALAAARRIGSLPFWTVGGCLASAAGVAALAVAGLSGTAAPLKTSLVALGVGNGAFSIAAVALMMQLAGAGRGRREGVRMGLWGAAQAIAFACGGILGPSASDILRHALAAPAQAYAAVFAAEALLFCLAAGIGLRTFSSRGTTEPERHAPNRATMMQAGGVRG